MALCGTEDTRRHAVGQRHRRIAAGNATHVSVGRAVTDSSASSGIVITSVVTASLIVFIVFIVGFNHSPVTSARVWLRLRGGGFWNDFPTGSVGVHFRAIHVNPRLSAAAIRRIICIVV